MATQVYGYARVSTLDQNLARQLEQLRQYIPDERYIIKDKASGKNFDRRGYNSLIGTADVAPRLYEGDLLIICSLDRLGSNYNEVKEQWELITRKNGANIKVLDMPLLDTSRSSGDLDGRFIADLVLQILSYTAEKERENTRKRQRQGIDAMAIIDGKRVSSKTGRPTGRPAAQFPVAWAEYYDLWKAGQITAVAAMQQLNLTRSTFYKLVHRYEATQV